MHDAFPDAMDSELGRMSHSPTHVAHLLQWLLVLCYILLLFVVNNPVQCSTGICTAA